MSELDKYLKEVRARVEAATPGPWDIKYHRGGQNVFRLDNQMTAREFVESCDHNLALIASAPTDLTKLVRICEVLREGLSWYAGHDPEKESEYCRAGLWRNAVNTLTRAEEL